jgi:SHS2 domain-containing protein
MADTIVEAYGESLEEAFENSALALVNIMFEVDKVVPNKSIRIEIQENDIENLLYSWLEKILLLMLTDEFIPLEFDASINKEKSKIALIANVKGENLDYRRHVYKIEVKAITYHEMHIKQERDNFNIRYLVDL